MYNFIANGNIYDFTNKKSLNKNITTNITTNIHCCNDFIYKIKSYFNNYLLNICISKIQYDEKTIKPYHDMNLEFYRIHELFII
jgi:hypothetical protein